MKEQRSICLGGTQISYTLERKAVKNVNLRLRPETGLLVSAPKDAPLALVERILQQHGERILQTLRRYDTVSEQPPQYPVHYTAGETVLYLGKYCRLSVEQGSRDSVQVQGETIRLLVRQPEQEALRKKTFDDWWERSCEKAVRNLFRAMVSQWGNCRPQRGILTFNTRLLAAPVRCIEYVVMHEFTHFLYADHSRNFYGFVAQELPDWKQLEMQLRQVQTRL